VADWGYRASKRLIDVIVAGSLLLLAAPILLVAAWLVRREMGSPVLFRHTRSGRNGTPFDVLKLRTMRDLRPGEDQFASDAARLTPLGAKIRSWSLDEIPQLVNVLKGDMSLVGPRPLPRQYVRRYTADQRRRMKVRPGITGLAQVSGRNSIGWDDRLTLDVWYVDHASLLLDLKIMVRTALLVLRRSGIAAEGHATMPELQRRPLVLVTNTSDSVGAARLQRQPAAVWRRVGPAVVIAVRDDVDPHLVGGIGAWVWNLLDQPRTQDDILTEFTRVGQVSPPGREHVQAALEQLTAAGVLVAA
jgi:lipopolysaccharide/colanic/teichoic acid biosynthesis glycosyltransferase